MNLGSRRWMIVSILIELAMDHKPSHREMASTLISDLYQKVISQRDIGKGERVHGNYRWTWWVHENLRCSVRLPAAAADGPYPGRARRAGDAGQLHGARHRRRLHPAQVPALVQGPGRRARGQESFNQGRHAPLHEARTGQVGCRIEETLSIIYSASWSCSIKIPICRLDNVWGIGGGVRPVKYLVKKIVLLLKEYLCSGDIEEATLCLKELEVPHFHHELVYEVS